MSQDTQNLQQASKFVNKVTEDKLNTQKGSEDGNAANSHGP